MFGVIALIQSDDISRLVFAVALKSAEAQRKRKLEKANGAEV